MTKYRIYKTISDHFDKHGKVHEISTGWDSEWRSAAVYWGEALPGSGWHVIGNHWMKDKKGKAKFLGKTEVDDCDLYNGWWGYPDPGKGVMSL